MSKKKKTSEQEKDDGYIEIQLPDLSKVKERIDSRLERISEAVDNIGTAQIAKDIGILLEKGRVGLDPGYARAGMIFGVLTVIAFLISVLLSAPLWLYGVLAIVLICDGVLIFLGKYAIHFDKDGFSTRFGQKVLCQYEWSEVTDVADGKSVFVNGKKLFADSSMQGFDSFYHRARAACKGKGKSALSEKKRKNRKKMKK